MPPTGFESTGAEDAEIGSDLQFRWGSGDLADLAAAHFAQPAQRIIINDVESMLRPGKPAG